MAKSSGHNLSKEVIKNAIWFDIEKQKGDVEPAVTGMLVDGLFSIIVHDEKLTCGADYSELKLISGEKFYSNLLKRCLDENRKLISYTSADFKYISTAYPMLKDDLEKVHIKASFSSWFRRKKPELFSQMQANAKKNYIRSKNKFGKGPKKNGEFRVGLKDMLKIEAVGYPDTSKIGIGGSAKAIKKIRDRFDKTGDNVEKVTAGEKKSWSKMLTYLKHDVYGLCHLTNWVNQNK